LYDAASENCKSLFDAELNRYAFDFCANAQRTAMTLDHRSTAGIRPDFSGRWNSQAPQVVAINHFPELGVLNELGCGQSVKASRTNWSTVPAALVEPWDRFLVDEP
jgi:hypothetical protein